MRLSGVYRAANDGDDADAAVAAPVACAGAAHTAGDCGLVVATVVGGAQVALWEWEWENAFVFTTMKILCVLQKIFYDFWNNSNAIRMPFSPGEMLYSDIPRTVISHDLSCL